MYYEKGQHFFTETTQEQLEKQRARFEEFAQCIESNTTVVTVPQLATLTPERRDVLERVLGQYGLESAVLALSPGYIWWTDDFVAAEAAKSEFGVERTWSQAILEHIANLGLIDRNIVDEAYSKLVGFNYQSTHFTGGVMIAALRVSNGSVDLFPMRQIVDAFRPTAEHGTPPSVLRCELAAVGYREISLDRLGGANAYLAIFAPPSVASRTRPEAIAACKSP